MLMADGASSGRRRRKSRGMTGGSSGVDAILGTGIIPIPSILEILSGLLTKIGGPEQLGTDETPPLEPSRVLIARFDDNLQAQIALHVTEDLECKL